MIRMKVIPKIGDIINGVEILDLDLERTNNKAKYWKYKCPKCGKIKSARTDRIGS